MTRNRFLKYDKDVPCEAINENGVLNPSALGGGIPIYKLSEVTTMTRIQTGPSDWDTQYVWDIDAISVGQSMIINDLYTSLNMVKWYCGDTDISTQCVKTDFDSTLSNKHSVILFVDKHIFGTGLTEVCIQDFFETLTFKYYSSTLELSSFIKQSMTSYSTFAMSQKE